jgi:hypothetical protein
VNTLLEAERCRRRRDYFAERIDVGDAFLEVLRGMTAKAKWFPDTAASIVITRPPVNSLGEALRYGGRSARPLSFCS